VPCETELAKLSFTHIILQTLQNVTKAGAQTFLLNTRGQSQISKVNQIKLMKHILNT